MKLIDKKLLDETTAKAKQSPRLRMNYNFHEKLDDPINRLLNAMEPGTYIRPHRHTNSTKDEITLVLRGKVAVFIFDDDGMILEKKIISPQDKVYGVEFKANCWHSLLVLETGTVVYEVKEGPFTPLSPDDMAPWSPDAEKTTEVNEYLDFLHNHCF